MLNMFPLCYSSATQMRFIRAVSRQMVDCTHPDQPKSKQRLPFIRDGKLNGTYMKLSSWTFD